MNEADFDSLIGRIRNAMGCSKEFAGDYAMFIGENPEIQNGLVLVRNEEGRIIARLPSSVVKE